MSFQSLDGENSALERVKVSSLITHLPPFPLQLNEQESKLKAAIADLHPDERILNKLDLDEALGQLPEKSRAIIMMKSRGYNYEEISSEMDLSVSGVKMQVKRSMEQLRAALFAVTFLLIGATILIGIL